jgi:hypothetical protein
VTWFSVLLFSPPSKNFFAMHLLPPAVSLTLALCLSAQEPARQTDQQNPAAASFQLDRFPALEERVGGIWQVHYHKATKTPEFTYGTGIVLQDWRENSLLEARRHATQALVTYGDLLKLATAEYRESIGARMGNAYSFTFDQYFNSVPCIGGRADVRINMQGVIAMLGSIAYQIPADFDTHPVVNPETANLQAWLALGEQPTGAPQPNKTLQTRLVIWADLEADAYSDCHLAYECPVSNLDLNGNGKVGRYYIDALNAAVLHYQNDKHDCSSLACKNAHHEIEKSARQSADHAPSSAPVATTITVLGYTRAGPSAIAPLVFLPMAGLVITIPFQGPFTTNASGQITVALSAPITLTIGNLDGVHGAPIQGLDAPSVFATVQPGVPITLSLLTSNATASQAAHTTVQYWLQSGGEWLRSRFGAPPELRILDGILPSVNVNGTCNAYYVGNTIHFYGAGNGCTNMAFSTMVLHEWGHGIDDRYGGISNQVGDGLSEGWGDIAAIYHPDLDSPFVGLDWRGAGTTMRSGNNSTRYGTQTEVHAAGEVWMGFAWQVREQLRKSVTPAQAIYISDDIVLGSIKANATNQANAVVQVFIADDDDGNLINGTPHFPQLAAAALMKGLPFPGDPGAFLTHSPLPATQKRFEPCEVLAQAGSVNTGTITSVRVSYRIDGGFAQSRPLIPDGTQTGCHALLPPLDTSQSGLSYHLEATHSSGLELRTPTTGEWSVNALQAPPPAVTLRITPEQAPVASQMQLAVHTSGQQPVLIALGDTTGPTLITGLPPLSIGGNIITLPCFTDSQGNFQLSFTAPPTASFAGLQFHSEALTLDAAAQVIVSNHCITLITP